MLACAVLAVAEFSDFASSRFWENISKNSFGEKATFAQNETPPTFHSVLVQCLHVDLRFRSILKRVGRLR